jgi:hypothetical protein
LSLNERFIAASQEKKWRCSAGQLRPKAVEPDKWFNVAWQERDYGSAVDHDGTFAVEHAIVNLDAFDR